MVKRLLMLRMMMVMGAIRNTIWGNSKAVDIGNIDGVMKVCGGGGGCDI